MRRVLTIIALTIMGLFAALASMFILGEVFTDPGGGTAVVLSAIWVLPVVVVSGVVLLRPEAGGWLLMGLTGAAIGVVLWAALDPDLWRTIQEDTGPVLAIALFALSIPIAVAGWRRPLFAGILLVILGVVPLVSLSLMVRTGTVGEGGVPPQAGMSALTSPLLLVGGLLVIAGLIERSRGQEAIPDGDGPADGDVSSTTVGASTGGGLV